MLYILLQESYQNVNTLLPLLSILPLSNQSECGTNEVHDKINCNEVARAQQTTEEQCSFFNGSQAIADSNPDKLESSSPAIQISNNYVPQPAASQNPPQLPKK